MEGKAKKTKNALQKDDVMAKEVAVTEIQLFVERWTDMPIEDWQVGEEFPNLLRATQKGLVKFTDNKPKYTLAYPLNSDGGNFNVTEIDFRTRIKPSDLSNITKGLNIAKQQMEYQSRCLCYVTMQGKGILDKLEKFDYKVIEQVSSVFF